mgnify:CR=1
MTLDFALFPSLDALFLLLPFFSLTPLTAALLPPLAAEHSSDSPVNRGQNRPEQSGWP